MTKEFCTYKQSLALKELGFDEPCLAYYTADKHQLALVQGYNNLMFADYVHLANTVKSVPCPLKQQAFRFFREKYNLQVYIDFYHKDSYFYKIKSQVGKRISNTTEDVILQGTPVFPRTYEEAEQACLDKLIEIVKG